MVFLARKPRNTTKLKKDGRKRERETESERQRQACCPFVEVFDSR